MPRFLVMPAVGSCIETSTAPSGGAVAISKPNVIARLTRVR
jgi:hypothetical protein